MRCNQDPKSNPSTTQHQSKQGLVYILYDTAETASKALKVFNGRLFSGNCIAAEFYPLELYREKHPELATTH